MFDTHPHGFQRYAASAEQDTKYVLSKLAEREIPILDVLTSSFFESTDAMAEVAKMLSESALDLGFRHILKDLGHFTMSHQGKHFLDDVPEVMPVQAVRLHNFSIFINSYDHCF